MRISDWSSDVCSSDLAFPAATLFTPLYVGPYILVHTHHRVIATGHHRNEHAMAKVLKAFMSPEAKAHQIIIGTRSDYLVYCPERSAIRHFIKHAPHGLAARLEAGKTPSSLQPVAMPRSEETTSELQSLMRTSHAVF